MFITCLTHKHAQTQTTARLKRLLTQAGIIFTSHAFNTEDGIEGLGLQPFVSFYVAHAGSVCVMYLNGIVFTYISHPIPQPT